jgi:hypothetical protein
VLHFLLVTIAATVFTVKENTTKFVDVTFIDLVGHSFSGWLLMTDTQYNVASR